MQLGRVILWFGLSALAAFGLTMAPLPWSMLGVVCVLAAIVLAIVGIARARRLPGGRPAMASLGIGLVFASLMLFYSALMAVQWPAQWDYQRCLGKALTQEAEDTCLVDYQQDSMTLVTGLLGGR
ncbi:MAG: hypothetical protein LBJ08_12265 [Bifidobacteriaceae bacterium]|jgi:hypothetical protein|nr:hypothetical protein [Bifidobacteriaceae bacterium]